MFNDFSIRHLAGWLCGIAGAIIAMALLLSTVSQDGIVVPDELDSLVEASQQEGYVPPASIDATCFPEEQVIQDTQEEIKQATGDEPNECSFNSDALDGDAVWGAVAFAGVLVIIGLGVRLYQSNQQIGAAVFVAALIAAVIVGAVLDDPFREWLTDMDIVASVFWRGFFATAAFVISGFFAHEAHRRNERTPAVA